MLRVRVSPNICVHPVFTRLCSPATLALARRWHIHLAAKDRAKDYLAELLPMYHYHALPYGRS
eukprot:390253-Pyramimonas_sp.AAC.1